MGRPIDADALISELELLARHEDPFRQSIILGVVETIRSIPTIDPESLRPRGRWVDNGIPYCPNCGAKMDREESK